MKTAWQTIKDEMTKNTTIGTMGYLCEVNKAAMIFVALKDLGCLKNQGIEVSAFNDDNDIMPAIQAAVLMDKL